MIRVGGPHVPVPGAAIRDPDYTKFDRALKTTVRPVLVSPRPLRFDRSSLGQDSYARIAARTAARTS